MCRHLIIIIIVVIDIFSLFSQNEQYYQLPSKEILQMADFTFPPSIAVDNKCEKIFFMFESTYKSINELSAKELCLAGLRINPQLNISSTVSYVNNIKYKYIEDNSIKQVRGLPDTPKLSNFKWSPDQTKIAFTNTTDRGVELWYFDFGTGTAQSISRDSLNANIDIPYCWHSNGKSLLVKFIPFKRESLIEQSNCVPSGPIILESKSGVKSPNRTYKDLIKSPIDEYNFQLLSQSELFLVDLHGNKQMWASKKSYKKILFSPDGKYVLVEILHKPYSYMVPYNKFSTTTVIYDSKGNEIETIEEVPSQESIPKGSMSTISCRREITWRSDKPSTIYWVQAMDGGDPEKNVDYRDEIFELQSPFKGLPISLVKIKNRYAGIIWGNKDYAVVIDQWKPTQNINTYVFNPSVSNSSPELLFTQKYRDIYNDPGDFDVIRNQYGYYILNMDSNSVFLIGEGYCDKGKYPFIDRVNLATKKKERIYQSKNNTKSLTIESVVSIKNNEILVSIQSPTEYPNFYLLNYKKHRFVNKLTNFDNPFKSIEGVYKQVVKYNRPDGVPLTGVLYLPKAYDRVKKTKLPMLLWAYPHEYKDKNTAGQSTVNLNNFTYVHYESPILWVLKGYAVFDEVSFPIVGEGENFPNDTFIEQLITDAKSAIDAVDSLGYIDRNRIAVGGQSYGAFMSANLLTHSDLFVTGIARSGAYNRTLTPFGFQKEERFYWDAPDVYNSISPFMHADKMKYPLLLIHGECDDNQGTHTMQSERYFSALKGLGVPARLVLLPREKHNYEARESILHMLWEEECWLDKYLKSE